MKITEMTLEDVKDQFGLDAANEIWDHIIRGITGGTHPEDLKNQLTEKINDLRESKEKGGIEGS